MEAKKSKLEELKVFFRTEVNYFWDDILSGLRVCGLKHLMPKKGHDSLTVNEPDCRMAGELQSQDAQASLPVKKAAMGKSPTILFGKQEEALRPSSSRLARVVSGRGKSPFLGQQEEKIPK